MNILKLGAFSLTLALVPITTLKAQPDVYFTDSNDHNGAYLIHDIQGYQISFTLNEPDFGIIIPSKFYNLDTLRDYIKNTHRFSSPQLKAEFIDMLNMSFESTFKGKEFLEELQRVLVGVSA